MRVQRVVMPNGAESWTVLGPDGEPVPPVEAFLAHLQALNRSPTTVRTYATTLKQWLQFHTTRRGRCRRRPRRARLEVRGLATGTSGERDRARRRPGPLLPSHGEPTSRGAVQLLRLPGPQRRGACAVAGGVATQQPRWLPAVPAPCHRRPTHSDATVAVAAVPPAAADPDQ